MKTPSLLTAVLLLCFIPPAHATDFPEAEARVQAAINDGQAAGVVLGVVRGDDLIYVETFGHAQVEPEPIPMRRDTVFDMASITKPVATALVAMQLVEEGKLDPDAKVSEYLPEFGTNGKEDVRVRHMMIHTAGLIPDNALGDYDAGRKEAFRNIDNLSLRSAVDEKFAYSDVGFIALGRIIEEIEGERQDKVFARRIAKPLGLESTTFNPPQELADRAAATEKEGDAFLRGRVHDPRAARMDGVAGHAGLFSTVDDLATIASDLIKTYRTGEGILLEKPTLMRMIEPHDIGRGTRTLGWDHQSPYSRNRGTRLSAKAFGHGGFTGTVLWIDPEKNLALIFLSNRLHPDGKGSVNDVAGEVFDLIVDKLEG